MANIPQAWRLDSGQQTLVFAAAPLSVPRIVYWGALLPEHENLEDLAQSSLPDVTGGMFDMPVFPTLLPLRTDGWQGHEALSLRAQNGEKLSPHFVLTKTEHSKDTLLFTLSDAAQGLSIAITFRVVSETASFEASLKLMSNAPIWCDWLAAPTLPVPNGATHSLMHHGHWCGEFQTERAPLPSGAILRESHTGRSGHYDVPNLILIEECTTLNTGAAWSVQLAWSGGHKMLCETRPNGKGQIQLGASTGAERFAGTVFESPALLISHSSTGLNLLAQSHHALIKPPQSKRRVHYNCWETVYFNHDLDTLTDIVSHAARLGAERFVLDDGWFQNRDDDTCALGDWVVDSRKYPDGLDPLIAHIHTCGMDFGLWVEPEMISKRSALYETHPDWVLGPLDQPLERNQYALDMSRSEVQAYILYKINTLLTLYPIAYLKWDHNRALPFADAACMRGTYAVLDTLKDMHPHLEIESCASGGGRLDLGMLARCDRVWLSDSNDALERMRIQQAAALFLPAHVSGSHVGPRQCHTSGRVQDMELRAYVAAQRHFGFEMDPRELTEQEEETLKDITAWWKANRHWTQDAQLLRLEDPDRFAELQLAQDGSRFIVYAGHVKAQPHALPRPLRLTGLNPNALYAVNLRNKKGPQSQAAWLSKGPVALKEKSLHLSGQMLMNQGIELPWAFPEWMWVIEGHRL